MTAAAIMSFLFGSFILENHRVVKLMGTGLATAIVLDATIVRLLLVRRQELVVAGLAGTAATQGRGRTPAEQGIDDTDVERALVK